MSTARDYADFAGDAEIVRTYVEGERLTYGHLFNRAFATEVSLIDPLPHQRIAVYEHMLGQNPLRFLLADDAGAGKTIMAGLYLREMLARRLITRVLVVPPAGLVSNWDKEMRSLFKLPFSVISGADSRTSNPFVGKQSDLIIISVDTLAAENTFRRLQEDAVEPYDLVIFDEAHKLSANQDANFRIRKTNRYKLGETLAGIHTTDERWRLNWACQHLLLLTATPHMGKDYPYYALWRLLDPEALSTQDAFDAYPAEERQKHFIRRTKEEMVYADRRPLYPKRTSVTLSFDLTQGEVSEQSLYNNTTEYIKNVYNHAKILNRSAARLAMSVFQRRLVSSTYALKRSLERRLEKLEQIVDGVKTGKIDLDLFAFEQQQLDQVDDLFETKTADEEISDGQEENEEFEEQVIGGIVETSLIQLEAECLEVQRLVELAKKVYERGEESKFEKLREVIRDPQYRSEKILIFTEHRDTLKFLVDRFEALGFTGQIAQIHGGMPYDDRDAQIEFFRKGNDDDGARYMIATDAAGEGLNMQFCRIMINYDIPWNPARLEQRMGRIHRYGQQYPVTIINLVAGKTREGKVLKTLLEKLERIRKELDSDKVFDVVGRVLQGISLKAYIEQTLERDPETVVNEIEEQVTADHVRAVEEADQNIYGERGDVRSHLEAINQQEALEKFFHLLPGFVLRYIEWAVPGLGLKIEGKSDGIFSLQAATPNALDPFGPIIETYPKEQQNRFTFYKPDKHVRDVVLMHPGEAVFEEIRRQFASRYLDQVRRGAVFVDPDAKQSYTYHVAVVTIVRLADPDFPALNWQEVLEEFLVGLRQTEDGQFEELPVEHLMLLRGGKFNNKWLRFVVNAQHIEQRAREHVATVIGERMANIHRDRLTTVVKERLSFVQQGYQYQEAELANARTKFAKKARESGDAEAQRDLSRIKEQQQAIDLQRTQSVGAIAREPELVAVGGVWFIAHALVVPSDDPRDRERNTQGIEAIAVQIAVDYERTHHNAKVTDVSTAAMARAAGLKDHPGFDLLSHRPDGTELKVEVKGRARIGEVEISDNEWAAACNLRDDYWLYVVYDCATARPNLLRVQDPFSRLLTQSRGVKIDEHEIFKAAENP